MTYYSDTETEKRLKRLERTIHREYKRAYEEMKATADSYFDTLKERYDREYEAYQEGAYTEAEFKAWYRTQVSRGEGYSIMADKLARRMVEADKVACAYINDTTPSIYSLNHDYEAYLISMLDDSADFHLVDEQTVKELMLGENHTEFKTVRVNSAKDYDWNSQQIHSALTAGILQGKSIDKLSESYLTVMKRGESSARRNARTSVTSAQNAGRQKTYEEATEMGIEIQKEWLATLDGRTRDSHQRLDGERVPYTDTFSNGLMYPADPDGAPREVYNCRCTMRAFLPKFGNELTERAYKVMGDDGEEHREYDSQDRPKTFKGNYKSYNKWYNDKKNSINYAKADTLFEYTGKGVYTDYPRFKIEDVISYLETQEIGKETIRYIEENNIKVNLNCEPQEITARGISHRHDKEITIFTTNVRELRFASSSVVHEITHLMYDIGNCQHAEAICFARERMFLRGKTFLTQEEYDEVVDIAKRAYFEKEWEDGGYGDYKKFDFVR